MSPPNTRSQALLGIPICLSHAATVHCYKPVRGVQASPPSPSLWTLLSLRHANNNRTQAGHRQGTQAGYRQDTGRTQAGHRQDTGRTQVGHRPRGEPAGVHGTVSTTPSTTETLKDRAAHDRACSWGWEAKAAFRHGTALAQCTIQVPTVTIQQTQVCPPEVTPTHTHAHPQAHSVQSRTHTRTGHSD